VRNKRLLNVTNCETTQIFPTKSKSVNLTLANNVSTDYSKLLVSFPELTTPTFSDPKVKHGVELHIKTAGSPIHSRARRLPPDKLVIAKKDFDSMLQAKIVGCSKSQWSSPLHMVPKEDGSWRPCGDYRRLNDVTEADRYPVPHIQDFSSQLHGTKIFSKVDLVRGYHQIPVAAADVC
jgi:hypothetical protein